MWVVSCFMVSQGRAREIILVRRYGRFYVTNMLIICMRICMLCLFKGMVTCMVLSKEKLNQKACLTLCMVTCEDTHSV